MEGDPVGKASVRIKGRDIGVLTTDYGEFWRILLPGFYKLEAAAAAAAASPLLKTPLSTAQQATYAAAATYTAVAARAYGAAAAAAQPVAGYAAVAGYGREYADPYLGHSIGPMANYGATVYRGGYNRFTPY
ncbi:hypothetical protein PV328_008516 [Microctonus aethiopoides]|uniref:Uncharacterized protein n=1 Tax=Microctonus aethiopoides TaxID=144406 RepID=A0AA39KR63_9HYME|nr:hypothetical protein PV328_008516 [Microctonus aethiopoides]